MQYVVEVFLELINTLVRNKEQKAKKIFWGYRFIFLGAILILFGLFLFILSIAQGGIEPQILVAIAIFIIAGTPALAIGIILVNNPKR